jgi:exopolysaccharide biosynthesis protein
MTSLKKISHFSCLSLIVALTATLRAESSWDWQTLFPGVEKTNINRTGSEGRFRGTVLKISLQTPGLSFLATPSNGERPGETDSQKTSTFLTENQLQAAINGSPFDIVHPTEGRPQDVKGLLISNGELISSASKFPYLAITKKNRARLYAAATPFPKDAWNAIGGFALILEKGKATQRGDKKVHPRTAVALSADGKTMYWIAIDGRQFFWSAGASLAEVASLCQDLGASEAINLDGGGTTTMVIADEKGKAQTLNRPIASHIPGEERPAGSHLGLRVKK